jgi:DNA-directed RNA polymerase subunit RPC12/RpoP
VDEVKPTKRKLTKLEQQVMALHDQLPELTDRQRAWMEATLECDYDGIPEHRIDVTNVGYYWKRGRVWCQHCGHVEEHVGELMEVPALAISTGAFLYTCPHCGKKLLLEPYDYAWKGDRYNESDCTIVTTIGGYTVFRTFVATRMNRLWQPTVRDIISLPVILRAWWL